MEREVGGGIGMGNTCKPMAVSFQCMTKFTKKKKKKEDEMVGWHHQLDGHAFEQAPGVGDGQGSLACYSPRGPKESDMTE